MTDTDQIERLEVAVGGLSGPELASRLAARGILLNAHAVTLLENAVFDEREVEAVVLAERTVAELGLVDGATLPEIFGAARAQGLGLCPADTAPYLRLAVSAQEAAPDSVMSSGRAPAGSLTVAAEPLSDDVEYPKGFYLRVVDGQAWLRGYRCDDEHVWSPADRFVFRAPPFPV